MRSSFKKVLKGLNYRFNWNKSDRMLELTLIKRDGTEILLRERSYNFLVVALSFTVLLSAKTRQEFYY